MPSDDETSPETLRDLTLGGAFLPGLPDPSILRALRHPDVLYGRNRGPDATARPNPPGPEAQPDRVERPWEAGLRGAPTRRSGGRRPPPQPIVPLGPRTPVPPRAPGAPRLEIELPWRPEVADPTLRSAAPAPSSAPEAAPPPPSTVDSPERRAFIRWFLERNAAAKESDAQVAWDAALRSSTLEMD